ncbi:MAG TPA: chemotaxis protein CheW [Candidatus Nanopelagicales bacterium]|nr:chemotaxis protein CheW [Candidatus Nanopelagicales bacterium]
MSTDTQAPPTRVAAPEAEFGAENEHLLIRLAGGRYGIAAVDVAEVVRVPAVAGLPAAPPWLLGIANWRGHVVPVIDLRPVLAVAVAPLPSSARLVVLAVGDLEVGVLAEAVTGLLGLPLENAALPETVGAAAAAVVVGLADGGPAGPIGVVATAAVVRLASSLPGRRAV